MYRKFVLEYAENQYGTEPEYMWERDPSCAVLRHKSGKWYGAILRAPKSSLGLNGDGHTYVLNVKCEPLLIDLMTKSEGFFRGYHMNKTNWLSILLDGTVDKKTIFEFIDKSYNEINGCVKKEKKRG